jgi:poly-gamma-glutamate synthesis protein (capsule biosynthesis protein)
MSDQVVVMGCGDIGPPREPTAQYAELAKSTLDTADIRFGQCERVYSERGARQVHDTVSPEARLKPVMADVFSDCGFDVVSVASNHAMDWGEEPLLDTVALFRAKGIRTIGGGATVEAAREPAIFEKNGVRVAFLGYCSTLPDGYGAGASHHDIAQKKDKIGVAPLRVHTYYEAVDLQHGPGMPPRIVTIPSEPDVAAMVADIKKAKQQAHVVVMSVHWGLTHIPRQIQDYQPVLAQAAFDAGADMILGHHSHVAQAVAMFKGKPCFYGLSSFIFRSMPRSVAKRLPNPEDVYYRVKADPDNPPNLARSLIAKAVFTRDGIKRISFLPVLIDDKIRPEVLHRGDPRFDDAVNYMEWVSQGHDHKFTVEGDEVVVTGAA